MMTILLIFAIDLAIGDTSFESTAPIGVVIIMVAIYPTVKSKIRKFNNPKIKV